MKNKRGFTLIELLVVIAVIGILASIVIVNLSGARDTAKDARITTAMSQVRAIAEILYSQDAEYDDLCDAVAANGLGADADLQRLEDDIEAMNGEGTVCYASGEDYCASAEMNEGNPWCITAVGKSGRSDSSSGCTSTASTCGL